MDFCGKCGSEKLPLNFVDGMVLCDRCHLAMTRLLEKWYDDKTQRAQYLFTLH